MMIFNDVHIVSSEKIMMVDIADDPWHHMAPTRWARSTRPLGSCRAAHTAAGQDDHRSSLAEVRWPVVPRCSNMFQYHGHPWQLDDLGHPRCFRGLSHLRLWIYGWTTCAIGGTWPKMAGFMMAGVKWDSRRWVDSTVLIFYLSRWRCQDWFHTYTSDIALESSGIVWKVPKSQWVIIMFPIHLVF